MMASSCVPRLFLLAVVCCFVTEQTTANNQNNYPVILVPGLGGSMMFAEVGEYWQGCAPPDGLNLWANIEYIFWHPTCFSSFLELSYDRETHTTHDQPGVHIHTANFGTTSTIADLDPDSLLFSYMCEYYQPLIDALTINASYSENFNLAGAPYDFRKAPNEQQTWYRIMTRLIEGMYRQYGKPVVIVGHSMGNPLMLYMYNHKPQAWKDKYIKAHVSLSGVWGGTTKVLHLITSGWNMGSNMIPPLSLRPTERSMVSVNWFMPSDRFWGPDEVLVTVGDYTYTVKDYEQLYHDLGFMDGYDMWRDTKDLIYDLKAPGVEMHCLYGYGINTAESYTWVDGSFPDYQPSSETMGDGDGTVNLRSLKGCLQWADQQKQPFHSLALNGTDHEGILSDPDAHSYIVNLLKSYRDQDEKLQQQQEQQMLEQQMLEKQMLEKQMLEKQMLEQQQQQQEQQMLEQQMLEQQMQEWRQEKQEAEKQKQQQEQEEQALRFHPKFRQVSGDDHHRWNRV